MSTLLTQAANAVVCLLVQHVDVGCSEQELIVWEALARRDRSAVQMCLFHLLVLPH